MFLNSYIEKGDCLEKMKNIPDGSVSLVLCDLPYGVTACKWDEVIPFEKLWPEWTRVCKSNGIVVLFGTEPFASTARMSNMKQYKYDWIWQKSNTTGFMMAKQQPLRNYENIMVFYSSDIMNDTTNYFQKSKDWLISEKQKAEAVGYNMREVLGNYMGSHYFTRKTQFAFPKFEDYLKLRSTGFFRRGGIDAGSDYDDAKQEYENAKRDYDEAKREYDEAKRMTYNPQMTKGKPYSVKQHSQKQHVYGYDITPTTINETGDRYPTQILKFNNEMNGYHPTQKPVALLEYLIKTYTNENELVLDNCMGSGSTCVACMNTHRRFIGIELNETYYQTAKNRLDDIFYCRN